MVKLVLIRHGQSMWNLENKFTGWTDVDLSPKGVEEAKEAGKTLKKDGYHFDESNLTADFFKGIDVAIEIRSNLISQNTKKVLKQRKNAGIKLGRPFGAVVKKRLDGKEDEIRKLLSQKVSKAEIARRFNVTRITVFNFVKQNGLEG